MKNKKKLFPLIIILMFTVSFLNIPFLNASFEDFTTYTESGDTGNMLSQNTTHTIWTNLDRNYDCWVSKDFGSGSITDFEHQFTLEVTDLEAGDSSQRAMCSAWVVAQQNVSAHPNDMIGFYPFNYISDTTYGVTYFQRDGGATYFVAISGYAQFNVDTIYYITVMREGTTNRLIFYSDSARTSIVWDSGEQTGVTDAYQYIFAPQGYDLANDPNDYSSGYITEFEIVVYLTITFRFNSGGEFRVDNATMTNGTETAYKNDTVLELASLPQNSSYIFSIFEWDSTNSTTNPHNFTVTFNVTVWCYFGEVEAVDNFGMNVMLGSLGGLIIGCYMAIGYKKRKEEGN